MSENFKATEHLQAAEFVPSWLKKPAAPAAAKTTPAPAPKAASSAPQQTVRRDPQQPFGMPPQPASIPWKTPSPAPGKTAPAKPTPKKESPPSKPAQDKQFNAEAASFMPPSLATAALQSKPPANSWAAKAAPAPKQSPAAAPAPAPAPEPTKEVEQPTETPTAPKRSTDAPLKATTYSVKKSDEEVLAISKTSKLAALLNAAAFVPSQKGKLTLNKVSPLLLPQSTQNAEMLFPDCWDLYYLDAVAVSDGEFDPTLVFRIDSVPSFWQTFNNIREPGLLPLQSTMYLFRDDINPKWEDPKNSAGGMWRLKVPADRIDGVWLNLCCRTVGESWNSNHRNTINGIVLKVRERGYWVEIWVTEKAEAFPTDVLSAVEQFFPSFNIDYLQHDEMQQKKKEALALAAASPKANKKKNRSY